MRWLKSFMALFFKCKHDWDRKDGRRTCVKCKRYEMLMTRRYPVTGEPTMYWQEIK